MKRLPQVSLVESSVLSKTFLTDDNPLMADWSFLRKWVLKFEVAINYQLFWCHWSPEDFVYQNLISFEKLIRDRLTEFLSSGIQLCAGKVYLVTQQHYWIAVALILIIIFSILLHVLIIKRKTFLTFLIWFLFNFWIYSWKDTWVWKKYFVWNFWPHLRK